MNTDVEELLRDGMERFTAGVRAPGGLAGEAGRRHRRRRVTRAALALGTAAVIAVVALGVATSGAAAPAARTGGRAAAAAARARLAAYVTRRVENALATENLVFEGRSGSATGGSSVTWAYADRNRSEEYWPAVDHRDRVVNGQRRWDFPPQDLGRPYLVSGTALVGGKLVSAYVTYFDRRYSLSPPQAPPSSACSADVALAMGAPLIPTAGWPAFINATLACGAARVTGHVRVNGAETTEITGKPVTVRLSPGYARTVHAKWATARWTLYVNPATYLPVRMHGSTETFGGTAGRSASSSVTDVRWLPPTPANIASTLVTIPPGFRRFFGPAGDQ